MAPDLVRLRHLFTQWQEEMADGGGCYINSNPGSAGFLVSIHEILPFFHKNDYFTGHVLCEKLKCII